ncbi:MAG: TonB-dependent receptor [Saprospiraceae bacterium]|nr:TonB-dependent receptor [Saprospiraceae bacterium]
MKNTLLILFFFSLCQLVSAQFPGAGGMSQGSTKLKGKISGLLIDSVSKEPVAFATVALRKHKSSLALDGLVTGDDGSFKFENVVTGKYDLIFSFIGYDEKLVTIETTLKDPDYIFSQLFLMPANYVLDAVEVQGERSLIENKPDKLVFNAENDASIAGGDAADVLRKVPLLSVDLNGNVSLRGSQNVRILINGKPSGMFSSNVADALKMFPADQIKKIEVITSPSAKYDGEGSAGIINIITKGKNAEGVAGSINASVGNLQNNATASLNVGKGRFGLNSTGSVFYGVPVDGTFEFLRKDDIGSIYQQIGTTKTSRLGGNANVNAFYDFNGYNSLNSTFNFRGFGFDSDGLTTGLVGFSGFQDEFSRKNIGTSFNGGFDWNTDFTRKFEGKEGREWTTAFQLTKDNNDQTNTVEETHTIFDTLNRISNIYNDGDNYEYTIQTDYVLPMAKGSKLEFGGKSVLRDIKSDFYNESFQNGGFIKNAESTNIFDYNQNVYAGYLSYSFIVNKKNNFIVGGRYEHTTIEGAYRFGEQNPFANDYGNFLPSITYSRSLPKFRSFKLNYSQRIQRPSLQFINPFNNNADQLNLQIGNPALNPELVQQLEASYNATFLGFTTFSSVYYKYTKNIIESVLKQNEFGATVGTYDNVGTNNSIGFNTFVSKTISKFTMRGGGNIYTYQSQGVVNNQQLSRNTYMYNLFLSGDFSFTGTLKMDFFGFFRSPQRTLQGDNPSFSLYGLGFRKEWKNTSLGLRVIEPTSADKVFATNIKGNGFTQDSKFSIPFRSLGINFRYKFGKVDFRERQSKILNSDLKTGDGGGSGQGTQGGGATIQGNK